MHADVVGMLGVVGHDEVTALLEAIAEGSASKAMDISAQLAQHNNDFADVLRSCWRRCIRWRWLKHEWRDSLDAEEVQLYCQIVLVGLRDIEIAPDPRSGFEMTLLRMLFCTKAG